MSSLFFCPWQSFCLISYSDILYIAKISVKSHIHYHSPRYLSNIHSLSHSHLHYQTSTSKRNSSARNETLTLNIRLGHLPTSKPSEISQYLCLCLYAKWLIDFSLNINDKTKAEIQLPQCAMDRCKHHYSKSDTALMNPSIGWLHCFEHENIFQYPIAIYSLEIKIFKKSYFWRFQVNRSMVSGKFSNTPYWKLKPSRNYEPST